MKTQNDLAPKCMWGENGDRMVCSRTLQFDEPALLKVVQSMLGGYHI